MSLDTTILFQSLRLIVVISVKHDQICYWNIEYYYIFFTSAPQICQFYTL